MRPPSTRSGPSRATLAPARSCCRCSRPFQTAPHQIRSTASPRTRCARGTGSRCSRSSLHRLRHTASDDGTRGIPARCSVLLSQRTRTGLRRGPRLPALRQPGCGASDASARPERTQPRVTAALAAAARSTRSNRCLRHSRLLPADRRLRPVCGRSRVIWRLNATARRFRPVRPAVVRLPPPSCARGAEAAASARGRRWRPGCRREPRGGEGPARASVSPGSRQRPSSGPGTAPTRADGRSLVVGAGPCACSDSGRLVALRFRDTTPTPLPAAVSRLLGLALAQ